VIKSDSISLRVDPTYLLQFLVCSSYLAKNGYFKERIRFMCTAYVHNLFSSSAPSIGRKVRSPFSLFMLEIFLCFPYSKCKSDVEG